MSESLISWFDSLRSRDVTNCRLLLPTSLYSSIIGNSCCCINSTCSTPFRGNSLVINPYNASTPPIDSNYLNKYRKYFIVIFSVSIRDDCSSRYPQSW